MRRTRRSENQRAEQRGKLSQELWGARPLAGWTRSAENKRLARRLGRRRADRLAASLSAEE